MRERMGTQGGYRPYPRAPNGGSARRVYISLEYRDNVLSIFYSL